MKMLMVVFNEAVEAEVIEVLERCCLRNYTMLPGIFGKGTTSGTHLGTDIWPGRNSALLVACEDKQAVQVISLVKELRKTLGREGVKAFVWKLEELT